MTTLSGQLGLVPVALEDGLRTGPWLGDQVIAVLAANALAFVLAFVGWWETSGISTARGQLGWLALSLVGVAIALGANAWFLARGRGVIRLGQAVALQQIEHGLLPDPAGSRERSNGGSLRACGNGVHSRPMAEGLVAASNMSRYHRSSCPFVAGKDVEVESAAAHAAAGRRPCEVCEP